MDLQRLVKLWQLGRSAIGMGLFCSFLTCAAGALLNALLDQHFDVLDPAGVVRRLIVGYVGAAVVVLLAFPFLSGRPHRRNSDDGA